ncbi:hypothetical protein [Nocardioides zeae]|uniref:Uncharacterized protein n=1 Tax=Nocardioides zeae TaxID=1457234 RepID=A0AAJ1X067_9ACTN|nr:hypothetical protein [Nocardioides zeae]MDQ1103461.1 hypothetical protein [Nocardioides zeae]
MSDAQVEPLIRIIRWPFAVLFPFVVLGLWFNNWLTRADQVVASVGFLLLWIFSVVVYFTARGQAWLAGPHRKRWADRRTGWLLAGWAVGLAVVIVGVLLWVGAPLSSYLFIGGLSWTLPMMIGERLIPLTDSTRGRGVPFPWEDPAQLPESWRS